MSPAAVILAAGASRRMQYPKALLLYQGETFLARLVRIFSAVCRPVVAVVGRDAARIRAASLPESVQWVVNPDPDRGQFSSLQCALASLPPGVPGFLFTPVDIPAVRPTTVARLAGCLASGGAPRIFIPSHRGRHGHPVAVAAPFLAEFLAAEPSSSARELIGRHCGEVRYVETGDAGIVGDIDDPASYRLLLTEPAR